MKNLLLTVPLTLAVLAGAPKWAAASSTQFYAGYCTRYAAEQFDRVAPSPGCDWGGDAYRWLDNAAPRWRTSRTVLDARSVPRGSVVVWSGGSFGHVAVLRDVVQDGVWIEEMNWGTRVDNQGRTENFGRVTRNFLTWSQVQNRGSRGQYRFVGYIIPIRR